MSSGIYISQVFYLLLLLMRKEGRMDGEGKREEEGRGGEPEPEYGKKERHQFAMPTETTESAVVW